MGFQLILELVTLNGIIAVLLCYYTAGIRF